MCSIAKEKHHNKMGFFKNKFNTRISPSICCSYTKIFSHRIFMFLSLEIITSVHTNEMHTKSRITSKTFLSGA